MQLLALADVLTLMDTTADPFTVVYYTADHRRRTGGERLVLEGCVVTRTTREAAGEAPAAGAPAPASAPATSAQPGRRKPAHRAHQTRNVTILSSGYTRKLHVRLIVEFNGQKVRW